MKSFEEIPLIETKPRKRSLQQFNGFDRLALAHTMMETPIFRFSVAAADGEVLSVSVTDEEAARKILLDEDNIWLKGPQTREPFRSLVPNHLIQLEGEYHAKIRERAQSALAEALLENRVPGEAVGKKLIQALEKGIGGGFWMGERRLFRGVPVLVTSQIDRIFRSAALDIVSTSVFGKAWDVIDDYSEKNLKADTLAKVMIELHWRVTDFNVREWRRDPRAEPAGRLLDILDSFVLDQMDLAFERVSKEKQRHTCMLDFWCRDPSLTREEIRNLVLTFLTMGSENVSTALSWCVVLLSENHAAQSEARKSKEALLNAFHEAMRLYPSVAALTRQNMVDTEICGFHIPRATEVQINMYSIHRNKNTWGEDAEEFKPQRCPVISSNGPPDAFPFGGGRRTCIGRPLTMHELNNVVWPVINRFQLVAVKELEGGVVEQNWAAKTAPNNFISLRPGLHKVAFVPIESFSRL